MRNRDALVQFWTSKEESDLLQQKASSCHLSKSAYLRFIINDFVPKVTPPLEYFDLLRELRAIGNNMRQIAHKAHALGMIEAPLYHDNANRLTKTCDSLMSAVLPTKRE